MSNTKSVKQRHLGRGLESLLGPITSTASPPQQAPQPQTESTLPPDNDLHDSLQQLPLASISPNPYQARTVGAKRTWLS